MKSIALPCLILVLGSGAFWFPQNLVAGEPAEWLKQHAVRLRSLDPADKDFRDLAPLKTLIGNARVVMLGEQTHGDGATFLGKTRLIEFLYAEMGFDVLCFESSLYECDRAWTALREGTDALTAMKMGIFPIWMSSKQLVPLTKFMDQAAKSDRPMELCGYDCQLTGPTSRQHLLKDIIAVADRCTPPALDSTQLAAVKAYITALVGREPFAASVSDEGETAIGVLAKALEEPRFGSVPERERAFWKQLLKSMPAFRLMKLRTPQPEATIVEKFNPRDEQGGDTLAWLARERYPERKIIVWAASMHTIRNHDRIETMRPDLNYAGIHSMGHVAAGLLGEDVFIISFTTGPGQAGTPFAKTWGVPSPPAGSLEALCSEVGTGPCIVPLRGASDSSFGGSVFIARPLGNTPMRSRWRDNVDAFVFTPSSIPSTR